MQNNRDKIWKTLGLIFVCCCLCAGCRENKETIQQPKVVVKKIIQPKSEPPADKKSNSPSETSTRMSPQTVSDEPADQKTESRLKPAVSDGASSDERHLNQTGYVYDPTGKADPFVPLIGGPPSGKTMGERLTRKKRMPRTPIEKVDLSQLKLVGIIRAESGNRAIVEEASGKGYIITPGTFIGIHSGKVSRVLKDRVIVQEETEDILGNIVLRNREMKLQKPPGEE